MTTETPTKTEIREYLKRTKSAARQLTTLLRYEQMFVEQKGVDGYAAALADWTEELTGSAGEVQNLIEQRYGSGDGRRPPVDPGPDDAQLDAEASQRAQGR